MIEVRDITKRFGRKVAVDDLSFDVQPGRVTGFLGPNGSGKSTTMRCMLGLDRAERGTARFDGRRFSEFREPLREVAALLDAGYVHPGRTGRNHLRWLAASNGLAKSRIDECLGLVGMSDVAGRKVGGYSLGMRQRLGIAATLLGDPHTIILDEPANGLDPEGVRWIRDLLVHFSRQGRTVLVSSHLLSEISLMADELVVIGRGRLIEQCTVDEFIDHHAARWVRVRTPDPAPFAELLGRVGGRWQPRGRDGIEVHGLAIDEVGRLAAEHGVVLHELSPQSESLEDAFLSATAGFEEYHAGGAPTAVTSDQFAPGATASPPPPPVGSLPPSAPPPTAPPPTVPPPSAAPDDGSER